MHKGSDVRRLERLFFNFTRTEQNSTLGNSSLDRMEYTNEEEGVRKVYSYSNLYKLDSKT